MSGPQNSEKVKLLISKLRKSINTTVNIDDLLPILDEFYNFLTTESKQLPASKIKNFILKALFLFKSAIKANKFIDDNETQIIYKHKLCKITSFYIDVELFSVGIGKDSSENIINRISTTIDSYFNEPENIFKIFRASLQIRKGKQIMKFKDIVIALFTKYFYRQARAQPLEIDDVLFLEQLSIYKIWSSLLDSQHHKDELSEMVINYMVPLHKQILMSQLGITDVDNFMNEALKTTSQQVIEKAIVNNTEIIDLDPDNSNAYVPSNINLTLLDYLNEEKVEDVCMPISWLDSLSIKTTERLIEKIVIIEIDDDDDDEIVIQDLPVPEVVDIDLNIVKNLSLDDKTAVPEQEIVVEACNDKREGIQNNDESFLKSDIPRTYSRKEKTDIAYKSFDTMEIGTMTDLMAHTKDTEMCVENESTTEPALSQSEIDDHLATSPLKIVKSFMCKTPLTPHPMFETNSIRPESVASKICIMERKTYIKEEETPIYGPINNIPNYVSKKEHPQRTKLNFDETALQYEVSPRRNRIFGVIGDIKKLKLKSVRFADEVVTKNNVPLVTYYGRSSVDHNLLQSFVYLERNIICEKLIKKMMSKANQQSQKLISHKKSQKSILKSRSSTSDDEKRTQLDKLRRIEIKNTRSSKRSASLNTLVNDKNKYSVELTKEKHSSHKKIKHRNSISVHENFKNETIEEIKLSRSLPLVSKNKNYIKNHLSSRSLSNVNDIKTPIVEVELFNEEKQNFITTVDTCNKNIDKNNVDHTKLIKMKMSQTPTADDECYSNIPIEHFEHNESNETEMLCYVLDSSTEEINIENELTEFNNKTDASVDNPSEDCAISEEKVRDECIESVNTLSEKYDNHDDHESIEYDNHHDHESIECDKSVNQLEVKLEKTADQLSKEYKKEADQLTTYYDESVIQKCEIYSYTVNEECKIPVDPWTEENNRYDNKLDKSMIQLSEEFEKSTDIMDVESEKSRNQEIEEHEQSAEEPDDESEQLLINKCEISVNHLNEECNQYADHLSTEYKNSTVELSDDTGRSIDREVLETSIYQMDEESTGQQIGEYDKPVDQVTENFITSDIEVYKESDDSTDHLSKENVVQLKEECEKFEEKLSENSTQELTEESTQDLTEEFTQELTEEFTQELTEESTQEITEESTQELTEEFTQELTEESTQELTEESTQELTEEYYKSESQPKNEELVDQLTQECDITVARMNNKYDDSLDQRIDECKKSPGYLNVEHLEETDPTDCNKYEVTPDNSDLSVLCNNNNVTRFRIRTPEYSNDKISCVNSYERNSFSPQDQTEDKANIDARTNTTVLNGLIESLYGNDNSKGEPIDLVTTGSSFDTNNQLQTTIPPFKKRRTISTHGEISNLKHFAMQSTTSPVNSEIIVTNNRILQEDMLQYFLTPMPTISSFNNLVLNNTEKLNAEQFYLKNKQKFYNKNDFKTGLNYPQSNAGDNRLGYSSNINYNMTGIDASISKYTNELPSYSYDGNALLMQEQKNNKKKKIYADRRSNSSMSNSATISQTKFTPSCESSNIALAGLSTESCESNDQIRRMSTKTIMYPIYNREKKESHQNIASTQSSNISEKYLPFKRRSTVRPRNSKTTRILQGQPSIINQEISYPSKPMMSIANMCTCQLMNYPSCSLHPRIHNFEFDAQEYISQTNLESRVKPKLNIYEPLQKNQRYENNYVAKLNTECYIGFKIEVPDVAANEEVFDQSISDFGVDEPPETGEFVEAYINYEETDVKLRKPKIKHSTKTGINQVTKSNTKSATKSATKSITKPATKSTLKPTKLTPYHFAMSPPNPPDSTTIPYSVTKKRGRPKGSKNRVKTDGLFLTLAESVNPSRHLNIS